MYILLSPAVYSFFFFFNDTATTEIYTLSLHDALPICGWDGPAALRAVRLRRYRFVQRAGVVARRPDGRLPPRRGWHVAGVRPRRTDARGARSEEHTSELQSRLHLVCRLLLEKKKKKILYHA